MKNGKYVILCVDDDPDVLNYLQTVLEPAGYLTVPASSAEEAKKLSRENDPDLYIVDLMMEEVDAGIDLVRHLKASGIAAPIFMLSSAGDSLSAITDYSALGLAGVFQKPLNPDTLLQLMKTKLK